MAEQDTCNIDIGESGLEETHEGELNEPAIDWLCSEFVRFIEEWLLHNLFSLSGHVLWNIHLQLHTYYTACPYTGLGWQPAPNPSPEADDRDDGNDDEPPTLTKEK